METFPRVRIAWLRPQESLGPTKSLLPFNTKPILLYDVARAKELGAFTY